MCHLRGPGRNRTTRPQLCSLDGIDMNSEEQRRQQLRKLEQLWKALGGTRQQLADSIEVKESTLRNYLRGAATTSKQAVDRASNIVMNAAKRDLVVGYLSNNNVDLNEDSHIDLIVKLRQALELWGRRQPAKVELPEGVAGALIEPSELEGVAFVLTGPKEDEPKWLRTLIHELEHKLEKAEKDLGRGRKIPTPRKTYLRSNP